MHLRKHYMSMSLQKKIQAMFLCMMAVCILFCFVLFYILLENKMETSAIEKEQNNRVSISKNLNTALENVNSISRLTMLRDGVRDFLTAPEVSTTTTRPALQEIHNILNTFDLSCNIIVFRSDGQYINTGPGITYVNSGRIFETAWLEEVRAQKGGYLVKANTWDAFRSNIGEIITFVRVINDISTQKEIGIMAINIPSRFFEQSYSGLTNSKSHFALYDYEGSLICCDEPSAFDNLASSEQLGAKKETKKSLFHEQVLTCGRLPDTNFILRSSSEVRIFEGLSMKMAWALFGGVLILLFFISEINLYIRRNVTYPIRKLADSMSEVQNGWLHRVSMNLNDDEIGQLKNSYNAMLIEINQLIDELIQKEKNLKKAELDALQEQMKPHFLYNTLDMIRYMALDGQTDRVYEMLETLGNFYRKFLSKGSIDITLGEEIDIVRNYLTLQKNRYEDVFDDDYIIEDGLSGIRVPRLILQPLVENSIYHGVRPKGEMCTIRITAKRKQDTLYLSVYDSGIGISPDKLKMLLEGKDRRSFGFQGTIERIRYYYKLNDVFEIRSIEGQFCEVVLKLPIKEG